MKHVVWMTFLFACASKPEANWDDGSSDPPPTDFWGSGTDDDSPTGTGGDEPEPGTNVEDTAIPRVGGVFEDFINVTDLPVGDLSCFSGSLGTETAVENCIVPRSMAGQVMDFQEDEPVEEAQVEFFWADTIDGPPDDVVTTDRNGMFTTVPLNTCEPFTYRVTTDSSLESTKTTIESHDVLPHFGAVNPVSNQLYSVSSVTYALIPNLLGLVPDVTKGIVAGRTYDCRGNYIEGLQVVLDDGNGHIPADKVAKYFIDDFPNRNQPHTSSDGLWGLVDGPTGNWTVKGYVSDGMGGHTLIGQTQLQVLADSINLSAIYTGLKDGVKMRVGCMTSCE